jgi:glucose-6-phosphate dehydrogenase assembly protein OpcA
VEAPLSANVHVATMALLVFVEEEPLAQWARERAHLLARRHASRVVVFNAAEAEKPATGTGEPEWIELGVRGCTAERVHALATNMLPAGMPRVLLWVAPQTQSDDRFLHLAPEMRTILLDSSRARDDEAALRDLAEYAIKHPDDTAIHDLAYLRLVPWQEVVADFFDDRAFVEDLFGLHRVEIASGSDAEGYYFLGWLASRLEWEPHGDRTFRHSRHGTKTIAYEIVREGQARRVRRITLDSRGTRFQAALCDSGAVSLEVTGAKRRPTRVEPLHDVDIGSLIERAILHQQPDPVFRESLAVAAQLLGV